MSTNSSSITNQSDCFRYVLVSTRSFLAQNQAIRSMKTAIIFLLLVASVVPSEGRQSQAHFSRGKRQNALNADLNSNQQQLQYANSPYPASFVPEYYQMTGSANPGASPELARERSRNVQALRRDAKYPASVVLNDSGSEAQRPQHNVNVTSGSSLKNEKSGFQNRIEDIYNTENPAIKPREPKNANRIPKMARKGARKNMLPVTKRTAAPVRLNSPVAAAAAADIQGAVVEKGIEVMGQMVDKQLKIIDEAQEKAENFLKKEIKLDIIPDKGWQSEDMFVPPGYHLDSKITDDAGSPKEAEQAAFTYPAGLGTVMMNGCYGTGYKEGDPCYVAKWTLDACLNMIDGAAFMGVGFDGRGEYSPESRKMSIVQRSCAGKATYDDYDVPDTMNVHGIYDTKATMLTFESRSEFQTHLQQEAGVSGSFFGFYAGVKAAWGESSSGSSQQYMAQLSVDINRYEVFLDEVKPQDLSLSFLREFMGLPTSYFAAGAPLQYQEFIQRWGTHYIKSSKFGGQLQIRKFMDATDVANKKEFAVEMEMEYKTLFSSVGAKSSTSGGEYSRNQSKTTSTTIIALGGSHEIASILSDAYSPTFKSEFKEWLVSIPQYPKPFLFQVSPITSLVNFRMRDLFPDEKVNWGCEGHTASLKTEKNANGDTVTYFESVGANGTMVKHYCMFQSRKGLEEAIKRRRISLKRAIEVYMEEGPTSISDFNLPACTSSPPTEAPAQADLRKRAIAKFAPAWQQITSGQKEVRVIFDMKRGLAGIEDYSIPRNMSRLVKYTNGKWLTGEEDGSFHLYNAFNNGGTGDVRKRKMSIFGLVLSYNEKSGGLELLPADIKASKQFFPKLHEFLAGRTLARVAIETKAVNKAASKREAVASPPCNVKWSNALRFDPTDSNGKCLHFTAASEGKIFVVFSTLPKDKSSWYYTEITPERVAIYKGNQLATSTTNKNARGLGDPSLLQSYFVCVTESESTTLIEYGKTLGTTESGDIYLNMLDITDRLNVRFYAFGNGDKDLDVIDAHLVPRDLTEAECRGDTHMDLESRLCTQNCHEDCDPLYGCNTKSSGNPLPTECNVCRVAEDLATGKCLPHCKEPNYLSPNKICIDKSGTFDLELGTHALSEALSVRQIPHLPSLTVCSWLRFLDFKTDLAWRMMNYEVRGTRSQSLRLFWMKSGTNRLELVIYQHYWTGESFAGFERISTDLFDDKKWHHLCVTFSGESGVFTQYVDGVRRKSETGVPHELDGGGTLSIGETYVAQGYQITGFNLWDTILSEAEIKDLATSCLKGIGNVKHWLEFSDKAKAISAIKVNAPSVCLPPVREVAEEEPPESSE